MNLQTERIENHRARLTVEIKMEQLDSAKKKAARKISRRVNIRGFRKGKAPYRLVVQHVGEGAILEEAIDELGSEVYRQAIDESEIAPYGPGELEDVRIEPPPTLVFTVPLQPEVDLKDYADVRLNFEAPAVTDEEVESALQKMREAAVEVLDEMPAIAGAGNRVTIDIHSEFVDGEEPDDEHEADADDEYDDDKADDDVVSEPKKGDSFVHQHDWVTILDPENDPVMEGFVAALIEAELELGGDVEFELTVPPEDKFESIVGRQVSFRVAVKKIEAIHLPALDDEFAQKVAEDRGEEYADMAALRQHGRKELEDKAWQDARGAYSDRVLDKIVEGAGIAFPEEIVEEYIDNMLNSLGSNLQQQGVTIEQFLRITGMTEEALREERRNDAIRSLRRDLAMRELIKVQDLTVSDEQIGDAMDGIAERYGLFDPDRTRDLTDDPRMRLGITNELLSSQVMTSLYAIGRGEDVEKALEEREAQIKAEREKRRQRTERFMARMQGEADEDAAADEAEVAAETPEDA